MPDANVRANGTTVRHLRQERGWTQEQLARKVGCVKKTIENAEAGKPLLFRTLHEIARAFGVAPHCLEDSQAPVSLPGKQSSTSIPSARHAPSDSSDPPRQSAPTEPVQRHAILFAHELAALKATLSLAYRCRNAARCLAESAEGIVRTAGQQRLRQLRDLHADLEDLLYEERALLPTDVFDVGHRLKHELLEFFTRIVEYGGFHTKTQYDAADEVLKLINTIYQRLDEQYLQMVKLVRAQITNDIE
jgi:transcriptional regulator with XRE-family HTH domain